ncbi:MAG: bifunctional adenosylcobinamide kinase/adenosylcobinamide-phosphate guanylyltransferase [bacterium]
MNNKLIFILGGAKSGKSDYALLLGKKIKRKTYFIATAINDTQEMQIKILKHQKKRPKNWNTIEESKNIIPQLKKKFSNNLIILDCLTVYLSNLFYEYRNLKEKKEKIKLHIKKILKLHQDSKNIFIIVSNEVGCGIVPMNSITREFRDLQGEVNQTIAKFANEVYFLVAGINQRLK